MALSGFTKTCSAHTPGITRLILLSSAGIDTSSVTITSNEVTALDVDAVDDVAEYTVDRYGLKATFEGKSDDSGLKVTTQKIEAHISKLTSALRLELDALLDEAVCGLAAIVTDANGSSWLYGLTAPGDVVATNQIGMGVESCNFDSGMKLDEDGVDKVTLTLSGVFASLPLPISSSATISASATTVITSV